MTQQIVFLKDLKAALEDNGYMVVPTYNQVALVALPENQKGLVVPWTLADYVVENTVFEPIYSFEKSVNLIAEHLKKPALSLPFWYHTEPDCAVTTVADKGINLQKQPWLSAKITSIERYAQNLGLVWCNWLEVKPSHYVIVPMENDWCHFGKAVVQQRVETRRAEHKGKFVEYVHKYSLHGLPEEVQRNVFNILWQFE